MCRGVWVNLELEVWHTQGCRGAGRSALLLVFLQLTAVTGLLDRLRDLLRLHLRIVEGDRQGAGLHVGGGLLDALELLDLGDGLLGAARTAPASTLKLWFTSAAMAEAAQNVVAPTIISFMNCFIV